ncbi:M20/M25/M40 family metallo-hydrolase [Novosphingobium ginsenosidimutans]|uniref:M20/M25/M40 family metallo-hydrolase n=1 Tax=Novosphingobium ginsenosidimutans TaxID=1176536 RepID=A0A5B8S3H4_9SPHN|nr:M20/M25/M40 family metallo-hydrolase [Novosphingobium ginsenosidimutans]QEA15981.1 M20/M25/M40 family metallo-hydrolase [Novosphingobium ginsenosidimutans]
MPMLKTGITLALALAATSALAQPAQLSPQKAELRELFKEMIETDTSITTGSCTLAAERVAARMKAAGFKDDQLTLFADPAHPKEGGLVAVLPGSSKTLKPLLLIAHIDVVAAKRADWERDPYTLIDEDGYFYGRGTSDTKGLAAIWTDILVQHAKAGTRAKRTLKMALTCGEETNGAFNGAEWLAANKRELIDAEFALNEGGGGGTNGKAVAAGGKVVEQAIQVGEKTFANYQLEARNPGGHSSVPRPDNAIYQLAGALKKIEAHSFPLEFTDTTRTYFKVAGAGRGDAVGKAMVALADNPADKAAEAVVNAEPFLHSNLRTTCVATMLDAGHARNALPQRAQANVNCRIFPGHSVEAIRQELSAIIGDPGVTVTALAPLRPSPPNPPLDPKVVEPARKLVAKYFPGVPLVPVMANGYTDATFLGAVGIPTYGVPGMWGDSDGNGVHGLNERLEVAALYTGRDFLGELVAAYAGK